MKTILMSLAIVGLALSVRAVDKSELDDRIYKLTGMFEALQQKPDKSIPADLLKRAQGIVLLNRTKAGFLFAYQGGGGIAMVRDRKTGQWSSPAFMTGREGSLGFLVGGEQTFYVFLLMTTNSTRMLTESTFDAAGEARGTAGNETAGVQENIRKEPPVIVYDDRKGLYGGAEVKAGAISPDDDDNKAYYGEPLTMSDILFNKKGTPSKAATDLVAKLNSYAKSGAPK